MADELAPKDLARVAGISASYASQILNGTRNASTEVALAAFRAFGARLGLLAEMTDSDIAQLCEQQCHAPRDASELEAVSAFKGASDLTCDVADSGGLSPIPPSPGDGAVLEGAAPEGALEDAA